MKTADLAVIMGFSARCGMLFLNGRLLIEGLEAEKVARNYGYACAEWFIRALEKRSEPVQRDKASGRFVFTLPSL